MSPKKWTVSIGFLVGVIFFLSIFVCDLGFEHSKYSLH